MQKKIRKAVFIDCDYVTKKGKTLIRLLLFTRNKFIRRYVEYEPYFYADVPKEMVTALKTLKVKTNKGIASIKDVKIKEMFVGRQRKELLKLIVDFPYNVPVIARELQAFQLYEYRIPFAKRFMIDNRINPFDILVYEIINEKNKIIKIKNTKPNKTKLRFNSCAFDIETYNPRGAPRIDVDPVIIVSAYDKTGPKIFTYDEKNYLSNEKIQELKNSVNGKISIGKDEREAIKSFLEYVKKNDFQLLYGYNSTAFDFPYLQTRAKKNALDFHIGKDDREPRIINKGIFKALKISGRIHIDMYQIMKFFSTLGLVKLSRYTLDEVAHKVFGKGKLEIDRINIWRYWDNKQYKELIEYSIEDVKLTYELAEHYLNLIFELAIVSGIPLTEIVASTSGQLVESLLMRESYRSNLIIPEKPDAYTIQQRMLNPIEGAFVKVPIPGIYEHIAVFDFRSLYPSIICSFNIDPYTYNCDCCKDDSHVSPQGHRFCKKTKGLIPQVLENLLNERFELKKKIKQIQKNSDEYKRIEAKIQALKIIANSFYGYLGYPRSRWYLRQAAESVTAFGRKYIQHVIETAEKNGFNVLYSDTDSIFIKLRNKDDLKNALELVEKINNELPGNMELEFENYYPRAVFVSKKSVNENDKGAKKKYAMIDEEGNIKIRGFEVVRRDWSLIAKNTQKKVLEAILKEGSKEKAVQIVKETINYLNSGKALLNELVIYTQLKKNLNSYAVQSPEIIAAKKANDRGMNLKVGDIIGFIITKSGRNISEKAEILEFAKDYDADYYINHQVLPAVMRIFAELGVTEEELKGKGKQTGLSDFFS
ncbi:MAG: DNA-directed DNA polymerase [Candidatus Micrarchaeota archaeon]|nr:DNA-directed DNA polymerase [Candidatus Micrarchaeota archaeon]